MVSLRFSQKGPAFPEQLVNNLFTGDVVFLCGAGISAPQLPSFEKLVKQSFERLRLDMNASERQSFQAKRYEEVLGSASRRIVDPSELTRTVMNLLEPPTEPDLGHHSTILRLSRNLDNQPLIITTNFDTLLEQAISEHEDTEHVRALSFAGQDLPPPSNADFAGIIHLHGRIAHANLGLDATPLVVTSADYGEAYMRSGWASRFLFDLCRCKTIVLVGYSAGDAPVRYFLNVLEADRQRFPDLHKVYALDAISAHEEVAARWEALAVEPIVYEYEIDPADGGDGHSALWSDLDCLADVVERPRETRRKWAQEILIKNFTDADSTEHDRITWLYRGQHDLWGVAIETIDDAVWFDFFADRRLWHEADAAWIVAAWIARNFESTDRFKLAIRWLIKLGKPFADQISRRLRQASGLSELWIRSWRLLSISEPSCDIGRDESIRAFQIEKTLRDPVVLNDDLEQAVRLLSPVLELTPWRGDLYGEPTPARPEQLEHLTWPRLQLRDQNGAARLFDALVAIPQPNTIMSIATARLESVVNLSLDTGIVSGEYDGNNFSVPSIEAHPQNEHHDGIIYLIQVIAAVLPAAAEADRIATRRLAEGWATMPGKLGIRLWLQALRSTILFTANEAIEGLMALSLNNFWTLRRELALVLRDRAADADADTVSQIEQRILEEGKTYYARHTIEEGQADWRPHALDTAVWLRLSMIGAAGRLSDAGAAELVAIKERRDYLAREIEDHDFFDSYSTGARWVVGDAQPIIDASDTDRLEIAREAIYSPDIEKQQGWRAYCKADPHGAFDILNQAPLDESNALLWNDLIGSLSFSEGDSDPHRSHLIVNIFSALEPATDEFLTHIIDHLSDLYFSAPRSTSHALTAWWPRLFTITVENDRAEFDPSIELIDQAINSPGGRLTQAALLDISERKQSGGPVERELLDTISQAASAKGRQGVMARAILVERAGFVETIPGLQISTLLDTALGADTTEAVALRSVLVTHGHLSISAYRAFSVHILLGVAELDNVLVKSERTHFQAAAAKIIFPALSIVRRETDAADWGLALPDVAQALRDGPPALRVGAAEFLKQWITKFEGGPAAAWSNCIEPLLAEVWPRERALRESELTPLFADLAVYAGDAFPEALERVLPYIDVLKGHHSTYAIRESQLPEKFPCETLTLLWKLFGIGSTGDLHGVPQILDRLISAQPTIEVDRRLQWLYQRAVHYD